MENVHIRGLLPVIFSFFVAGLFLSQVSPVVLQSILSFGVSEEAAGVLEMFKDGCFVIGAFFMAPFLAKLGDRKILMLSFFSVIILSLLMVKFPSFTMTQIMFIGIGFAGALIKISVYSAIGAATEGDNKAHAKLISLTEAFFGCGMLSVGLLFAQFVSADNPSSLGWLDVYYAIAAVCAVAIIVLCFLKPSKSDKAQLPRHGVLGAFVLLKKPVVQTFVITVFFCVMVEQAIGSWYSTFYHKVIGLNANMAVTMLTSLAIAIIIGRLLTSVVLSKLSPQQLVRLCIVGIAVVTMITVGLSEVVTHDDFTWTTMPISAYIFPLVGVFIGPVYPLINSAVLTALPHHEHPQMTAVSIVFSALGGGLGSVILGFVFGQIDGRYAMLFLLIPLAGFYWMVGKLMHKAGGAQL